MACNVVTIFIEGKEVHAVPQGGTTERERALLANTGALNEIETEELIDAPAMGRAPHQFWKTCSARCKRIVARSPAFAVALLRHTRPEPRYYGESKLGPWFELLE